MSAPSKKKKTATTRRKAPAHERPNGAERGTSVPAPSFLADMIQRVSRQINELTLEDLRRFGMTVPRWSVLSQLAVHDGRSIGDLSRVTVIKQSSLTRVVDQMERDGLVKRKPARSDHRIVEVWLTKQGRETYDRVVPHAVQRTHQLLEGLRDTDRERLSELLDRVLSNVRGAGR